MTFLGELFKCQLVDLSAEMDFFIIYYLQSSLSIRKSVLKRESDETRIVY